MIDLHNHILPRVDDGARGLDEALEMAEMAAAQGTTVMAATPHRFSRGREHDGRFVEDASARLQIEIDKRGIGLRIVPGIELPMRRDTLELLQNGGLIPLGGKNGRTVLIEPPFERIPEHALPLLESLQAAGYAPLIAHPERNEEVQSDLAFLEKCAAPGMAMQLTAGSILGKFGPKAKAAAKRIVSRRDWQIVIASDAHDLEDRVPSDLRLASEAVAQWLGGDEAARIDAHRMVEERPGSLLPDLREK